MRHFNSNMSSVVQKYNVYLLRIPTATINKYDPDSSPNIDHINNTIELSFNSWMDQTKITLF